MKVVIPLQMVRQEEVKQMLFSHVRKAIFEDLSSKGRGPSHASLDAERDGGAREKGPGSNGANLSESAEIPRR